MGLFSFLHLPKTVPLKLVLYLDIGRGNSRGAVVEMRDGKPYILYTVLGEQNISDGDQKDTLTTALSSLEQVLDHIARILDKTNSKDMLLAADEVYCILAAPYYLSHTTLIHHKSEKEFSISPHFIDSLLKVEKKNTLPAHEIELVGENGATVHERIIDIKINGYHVSNPYGKTSTDVTVSAFRTSIDPVIIQSLVSTVRKFTPAHVSVEPLSLAAFIALRNRVDAEADFLFMTIGSEISEVSLVRNHTLLETVSFPYGKYSLVRYIAQKMGTTNEDALARLGLYHDKKLAEPERAKLEPFIKEAQAEWLAYLERSLISLTEETSVPPDLYLLVDTDLKDIFSEISAAHGFASQTLVPNGFRVSLVDTALLADSVSFSLDIRFDTILAISASFAAAAKEALPEMYPENKA